jgi:peroxiredoxin
MMSPSNNLLKIVLVGLLGIALVACASSKSAQKENDSTQHLSALSTPKPAIEFTLQDLNGESVGLADLKGKVVWISFWATWCHACQLEMRYLNEMQGLVGGAGFQVLAINVDGADEKTRVISVARALKLNYPVLLDPDSQVVSLYNPSLELPVSVLIDKQGQIRYVLKGYEVGENQAIQQTIQALVSE